MSDDTDDTEQVMASGHDCLEYEWGCPNYSSDQSRWCDNCRARVNSPRREEDDG